MNIIKNNNFGTHNTSVRTSAIKYLVIHYVGATGDAKNNILYYNQKSTTSASADFYVGHGGDIHQYNPDPLKRYCWAIGGGRQSVHGGSLYGIATNSNSIHIEMCVKNSSSNKSPNSSGWVLTKETYLNTIELAKYLMKTYNISSNNVIRHFDVNGKYCPGIIGWNAPSGNDNTWKDFKSKIVGKNSSDDNKNQNTKKDLYRIRKDWKDEASQIGAYESLDNAKKACNDVGSKYHVYDKNGSKVYTGKDNNSNSKEKEPVNNNFQVKITANILNIRKGPGTNYAINGSIKDKGIYTIVKVQGDWGQLLSGAGWINLNYTKKIK